MKTGYLTYRVVQLQNAPKIHTDLLWDLTWLFLILTVLYFAAIFYYRNRISAQSKKVGLRKTELSPMISEFLFFEENSSNDEKSNYVQLKVEIRQLIKDDFNRRVLCEVLLDLRKDVSGDTQQRLFQLYKDLGLHKDAYKKLKSWKWHVVSKGILELTQMRVEESYSLITKFVNDKRGSIRKQAEIATVTLKYEGINYFLDNTRFKISEWQQLKLLDVIRNFEEYQPPRFKVWLTSTNRNVVLFALRLIKYYNQNDAKASLLELVKHKNNRIKSEAIACIKDFNLVEASEVLKTIFWKSTADLKILILDVLASFGQDKDLDFLRLIEKKESNFSVKSKALSAINTIRPESVLPTEGILDVSGYRIPEDIVVKSEVSKEFDLEDALCEVAYLPPSEIVSDASEESTTIEIDDNPPAEASEETSFATLENERNTIDLTENDHMTSRKKQGDITTIQVVFEEVSAITTSNEVDKNKKSHTREDNVDKDMKDIDLGFLPLVLSEGSQLESNTEPLSYLYSPDASLDVSDVLDTVVYYTEVRIDPLEKTNYISIEEDEKYLEETRIAEETALANNEERYSPTASITEEDLTSIEVEYVEINAYQEQPRANEKELEEEKALLPHDIDETELDFLPIVVDEIESYGKPIAGPSTYSHRRHESEVSRLQLLECEVCYDEVPYDQEEKIHGVPSQDIIPIPKLPPFSEDSPAIDLVDIEVDFEEVRIPDITSEILQEELPKIEFYSEATLQTMSLLDDIEELGDDREIPLLLEYLEEAEDKDVRNRIRELIKKFAHWEPKLGAITSQVNVQKISLEYNVLEELFSGVDLEEKIILLDAVSDIVDEQDLNFLLKIKDHPEQVLRDKATVMILELEKRLSVQPSEVGSFHKENNSGDNEAESDLFTVEFEISVLSENSSNPDRESKDDVKDSSFLEQLLTLPNKIIKSFNG